MESSQPGFGSRFWSLIGATFLGFLGMGTVLPALAPYVRNDLGGSDRTVGFVIGTFSFIALGSRFISGPLADRRGRKITMQTGLMSCACAGLAYLVPLHLPGVYLGRALQGFGEACLYTGAATWAVELAGVERALRRLATSVAPSGAGSPPDPPLVTGWVPSDVRQPFRSSPPL